MPHSIRLRGPWEYQPLVHYLPLPCGQLQESTRDLPPRGTIELPADCGRRLGAGFFGKVRFTRTFHRPTGLAAQSRVWLVIEEVDWQAVVTINGRICGEVICSAAIAPRDYQTCPARLDITADLLAYNRLEIEVSSPRLTADGHLIERPGRHDEPGGLMGLVRLEIE